MAFYKLIKILQTGNRNPNLMKELMKIKKPTRNLLLNTHPEVSSAQAALLNPHFASVLYNSLFIVGSRLYVLHK